jgi:voltage-gated sodium channel
VTTHETGKGAPVVADADAGNTASPGLFSNTVVTLPPYRIRWLARLMYGNAFEFLVIGVIIANAAALAVLTYADLDPAVTAIATAVDRGAIIFYTVEVLLRIISYGRKPWMFFRNGWNVFDFVVILAVFVPGIRQNSTLLRLLRLLRVVRIVRVLPDLRVLLLGVWRSVPPLASIGAVTAMILFVYGMVGWIWFGDELPEQWGNIGRAMLTLFVMLTLEDFPVYMADAMEFESWAWIYFVSFILVAAFIVLNVLIGVVLNSMEEARELDRRAALRARYGVTRPSPVDPEAHAPVAERIVILRSALDELELELAIGPTGDERRPP